MTAIDNFLKQPTVAPEPPNVANSFNIHTYERCVCKSFIFHTYETLAQEYQNTPL